MLSRPFIINTSYYSFELPNLRLEGPDTPEGLPSPIAHVALQCQLGEVMAKYPMFREASYLQRKRDQSKKQLKIGWLPSRLPIASRARIRNGTKTTIMLCPALSIKCHRTYDDSRATKIDTHKDCGLKHV